MKPIKDNLTEIRERITAAAQKCGRDPHTVTLLAVSKTKPVSALEEAIAAGQTRFGENYVQEGVEKFSISPRIKIWNGTLSARCSLIKAVWLRSILTGVIPSTG